MDSELYSNANGDNENDSRNGTQFEPHQTHETKQLNEHHGQNNHLKK